MSKLLFSVILTIDRKLKMFLPLCAGIVRDFIKKKPQRLLTLLGGDNAFVAYYFLKRKSLQKWADSYKRDHFRAMAAQIIPMASATRIVWLRLLMEITGIVKSIIAQI